MWTYISEENHMRFNGNSYGYKRWQLKATTWKRHKRRKKWKKNNELWHANNMLFLPDVCLCMFVCVFFLPRFSSVALLFLYFFFPILLSTLKYTRIDFAMSLFLSNLLFHCYLRQIRWEKRRRQRRRRRRYKKLNGTPKNTHRRFWKNLVALFAVSIRGLFCKLNCKVHSSRSIDFFFFVFLFWKQKSYASVCIWVWVLYGRWRWRRSGMECKLNRNTDLCTSNTYNEVLFS